RFKGRVRCQCLLEYAIRTMRLELFQQKFLVQFRRIKTCENLRTSVRQRRYSANDLAIVTLCDKAPFLITWRVDNNDVVKTCLPYSSPGFQNIQHHKCSTLFGNAIQPVIGSAPRNGLTTHIDVHDALRIRTRGNDRETAGKRK